MSCWKHLLIVGLIMHSICSSKITLYYIESDCLEAADKKCPIYVNIAWKNPKKQFGVETNEIVLKARNQYDILDLRVRIEFQVFSLSLESGNITPASQKSQILTNYVDANDKLDSLIKGELFSYSIQDKSELTLELKILDTDSIDQYKRKLEEEAM